jgi:hypothetical protein
VAATAVRAVILAAAAARAVLAAATAVAGANGIDF